MPKQKRGHHKTKRRTLPRNGYNKNAGYMGKPSKMKGVSSIVSEKYKLPDLENRIPLELWR